MKKSVKKLTDSQIQVLMHYKNITPCSKEEAMRALAILCFEEGLDSNTIEKFTAYSRKYASSLRRKYIAKGLDSLKDRKKQQPRTSLTKTQKEEILSSITNHSPKHFGYDDNFWTTRILAHFIEERYQIRYHSKNPLWLLFKEARFTYHKPDKQYKNRSQKTIDDWCAEKKPIIKKSINEANTVVLVGDEMMLSTQTLTQKIWLPQGAFPKIDVSSMRKIRCIYGFLNIQNGREHAFKAPRANSEETCKVLDEIGSIYPGKKIVIIWDNASWHKSEQVKDFLRKTKHTFHLKNFPPYAPELNPQEHVWKAGRAQVSHNKFIANIDEATDVFVNYLNSNCFDYKFV